MLNVGRQAAEIADVHAQHAEDQDRVRDQERQEDRHQDMIDSFTPRRLSTISSTIAAVSAQIFTGSQCAPVSPSRPNSGVARRGDRDGDGQDVIDDQRAAGQRADFRPEHLAGDEVAAAAAGKRFDDVAVAGRDDDTP